MAAYVEANIVGDPGVLENLFQQIIIDLKAGFPIWEDFTAKATKLHYVLRSAINAISAFLEAMQKVADMALSTRGATSDLGSGLTRLCLRQRGLEDKLKAFVNSILDCLVNPLQDRMDEWKKMVSLLDKDHAKESKRVHQDMKRAYSETVAIKKKVKKGKPGAGAQLDQAVAEYKEKYDILESLERNAVRMALIEERSRFCHFINCLNPVMDCQVAMLSELTHVSEIINYLRIQTMQPCFGPGQIFSGQEAKWTAPPDVPMLSSPASPAISRGSSNSSQGGSSGDGCCHSPASATPALSQQHQQHHQPGKGSSRHFSDDSSNGNIEDEHDQFLPGQGSWSPDQSASRLGGQTPRQRSNHCAKCCHQCMKCQSPVINKVATYAVPTTMSHPGQPGKNVPHVDSVKPSTDEVAEHGNGEAPIAGYVNMNQLASLAVHQNDSSDKINASTDKLDNDDKHTGHKTVGSGSDANDKETNNPRENNVVQIQSKDGRESREHSEQSSHGRSRTTEDIVVNRASYNRQTSEGNNNISNKLRDLSLPPTFRKPFRTGGSPNFFGSPKPFSSMSRGRSERHDQLLQEIKQTRTGGFRRAQSSESPPPPPLPEDYPTGTELVLESDYLPLPPPPVTPQESASVCWGQPLQYSAIPEGSLLSITGNRMDNDAAAAAAIGHSCGAGKEGDYNTFADSIRLGVKLKRTSTNDRSGPLFRSNKD